jgi:hypothetical protein
MAMILLLNAAVRSLVGGGVLAASLLTAGCGRRAADATPDGVARELVERMRRVQGDPSDAKAAYALLSRRARQNLAVRAERYSAASGKTIAPEAMIAPSCFRLHFEPQRYDVTQTVGTYALVGATGILAGDHAQIPCVFEDNAWRVDLSLPPLPPLQMRAGTAP